MIRALLLVLAVAGSGATYALAQAAKPPVPPGWGGEGPMVALIGAGIDYRQPVIATRLARDGEGEIIGWDCVDNDRRPFDRAQGNSPDAAGGDGTAAASIILAGSDPVRLVPVRADVGMPKTLGNAAFFASKTGARLVVVPMWSDNGGAWETFRQVVALHSNVLFVLAAGGPERAESLYPAAFNLANMLVVSAGEASQSAKGFDGSTRTLSGGVLGALLATRAGVRILARDPNIDVAGLKARIETALAAK